MSNKRDRKSGPPAKRDESGTKRGDTRGSASGTPLPPGLDAFPPIRHSLAHGLAATTTSPWLLLGVLLLIPVAWLGLRALGYEMFEAPIMLQLLAIPPVSSATDLYLTQSLFAGGGPAGIVFLLGLTAVRALVWGVIVGVLDEALEYRSISRLGVLRGLNAFIGVLLYCYVSIGVMVFGSVIAGTLGPGIGSSASILVLVGGLTFLSSAPAVAVRYGVPAIESLQRSIRGARLPGWPKQMMYAVMYFFMAAIVLPGLGAPFPPVTANPSIGQVIYVYAGTLVQIVFLAGFIDRWRAIEDYVPASPPRGRKR